MKGDNIAARMQYLDEASKCLLTASPVISAHFQVVRKAVVEEKGDKASVPSNWTCTACGSILVPGLSCKCVRDTQQKRTRNERQAKKDIEMKSIRLQCSRCDTVTTIETVKPERKHRLKGTQSRPIVPVPEKIAIKTQTTSRKPTGTADKTPRKRARLKKATTLQSMLADQKTVKSTEAHEFGLDLMDLMTS